ncbi:helix-turn-helix domain-containing protein [Ruminococcus albus]|uniref:Helix-turn-helix domain-containing protein n=1 Tax=Ruminococcus albus TaxID=1264 RepID=A0A1H7PTH7_RUMAL|nr:helix-turn-helix domain-containing protein [Ruminococcus albus]SEL38909.1 Helix-turn-helix domain-containing protein [Ruminococcus albus]
MNKGRKTTLEERIEIVAFCIEHCKDHGLTVEKYGVSYQQIYSWVRKYEEKRVEGLADRRGKAKPEEALTEADRLRMENKILQAKLKDIEMENKLLKKTERIGRWRLVSGVRNEEKYLAIQYMNEAEHYPIQKLCNAVHIARSAYYKWLHRTPSHSQQVN